MGDFVLVDLESQARAVALYLRGWSTEQIVTWLRLHGEVNDIPRLKIMMTEAGDLWLRQSEEADSTTLERESTQYDGVFRSYLGLWSHFTITADGKFLVSRTDPLEREIFTIHCDWQGLRH